MKVLIWFPINIKGGGARLFVNLVNALNKHREIEGIKIVLHNDCRDNEYFEKIKVMDSVKIIYYPEEIENLVNEEKKMLELYDSEYGRLNSELSTINSDILDISKKIIDIGLNFADTDFPPYPGVNKIFLKRIIKSIFISGEFKTTYRNFYETIGNFKKQILLKSKEINELKVKLQNVGTMIKEIEEQKKSVLDIIKVKTESVKSAPVDHFANDCDVVYFFWPHFIEFQKTIKPSVCTFQDVTILDFPENVGGNNARIFWELSKKWIENTTCIVTSSNYVKERLKQYYGKICDSIIVIPHRGSPLEFFDEKIEISSVLKKYKIPREYILYPGNLGFHKNHYNLLVAYSEFKYRDKYPLVLFGLLTEYLQKTPPDYPELINCARLVALLNRLKMRHGKDFYALGYIDDKDVGALIKNAKVLVMPSISEGGGSYPVEEALRCGVPVACSDIQVMREHLSSRSSNVVWFNPESTDSIRSALQEVIDNYDYYVSSIKKIQNENFMAWDEIADKYVRVFNLAIERKRKSNEK